MEETTTPVTGSSPAETPAPSATPPRTGWRRYLRGPLLVGVIAALIAIGLSLFGMLTNPDATPLTLRSFVLVVLIAGGSWGLIAWAVATAAVEAGRDNGSLDNEP